MPPIYPFDDASKVFGLIHTVLSTCTPPSLFAVANTLAVLGALMSYCGWRRRSQATDQGVWSAALTLSSLSTGAILLCGGCYLHYLLLAVPTNPHRPASYGRIPVPPDPAELRDLHAHDEGLVIARGQLHIAGSTFTEAGTGRHVFVRGVNIGGDSKVPAVPDGATWLDRGDSFSTNHRGVSFVGRPFPLTEAPTHFARLRSWGMTFCRFQVTWEAVEHAGPGVYDEEYLQYLSDILDIVRRCCCMEVLLHGGAVADDGSGW